MVYLKIYVKFVTSHSYIAHTHEGDRMNFLRIWSAAQNVLRKPQLTADKRSSYNLTADCGDKKFTVSKGRML